MSNSGNVVKSNFIKLSDLKVRVIDSNALVAKRLEGFSGLYTEKPQDESYESDEESEESALLDELTGDGYGGEAIDESEPVMSEDIKMQIEAEREQVIAEAASEAERIINEARAAAEAIRNTARDEGFNAGRNEALEALDAAKAELEEERRQMEEQYQDLVDSIEPRLVDAITEVYESVFGANLYSRRDVMICLINKALMHADSLGEVLIFVSSEDYNMLVGMKASLFDRTSFKEEPEIIQRDDYPKGKAKIETPYGIIDCSIDTELKELSRSLRLLSYDGGQ